MDNQKERSRLWFVLLYPDNPDHVQALELIKGNHLFVGILHDSDRWSGSDEVVDPNHKAGELKKPHWHLVVKFNDAVWNTSLSKQWSLDTRWMKNCRSFKDGVFYLVHRGFPDKFQYDPDLLFGPLRDDAIRILAGRRSDDTERIVSLVREGKSNLEIIEECPSAYQKIVYINALRQSLKAEKFKDKWRDLIVTYIWGDTAVGKTRFVMEQYGYSNVYRVTNYSHPFDGYKGEDVILFDEFRSSLPLSNMLMYLDGYPVSLPCRYNDQMACYTKVYIISNIPLNRQYVMEQHDEKETYDAFLRRIHHIQHMQASFPVLPPDPGFDPISIFGI